jgi:nicotinate-nucleotide adenylyltransferase
MGKKRKIGIMGGTFDPIHIGHLVTAEEVRIEYSLEKVIFIPAGTPPHKLDSPVTPAIHRYIMTAMATHSNPHFFVSAIELERPGPSFSVDTLRTLKAQHDENTEFYFITGVDAISELLTWNNVDQVLQLCHFVAATRPGCVSALEDVIEYFGDRGRERIHRLDTPELEISSTDIRDRIRTDRSIKYIVPESVESYILKESLYRG